MKTSTILKGVATVALLTSFGAAQADHLPSPCATGEVGQGSNCMYITAAGNTYNPGDGNRSVTVSVGQSSLAVGIWMDFGTDAVQGGGFDVLYDSAGFSSSSFVWNTTDFPGNCPTPNTGEQTACGADTGSSYAGLQFDDFSGNGYGGTTGTQPGFQLIGTLTLQLTGAAGQYLLSIAQPYTDATFPNCFAPGAGSGGSGCVETGFYNLSVQANPVPLPAAVWMMIAGLGSLAGFSRRRA